MASLPACYAFMPSASAVGQKAVSFPFGLAKTHIVYFMNILFVYKINICTLAHVIPAHAIQVLMW